MGVFLIEEPSPVSEKQLVLLEQNYLIQLHASVIATNTDDFHNYPLLNSLNLIAVNSFGVGKSAFCIQL